jgi:hypothetical protein
VAFRHGWVALSEPPLVTNATVCSGMWMVIENFGQFGNNLLQWRFGCLNTTVKGYERPGLQA